MLTIHIPGSEFYDSQTETFITSPGWTITLEHSLISISKWEAKWHKPFLGKQSKTDEETIDYIRCMSTGKQYLTDEILSSLTSSNMETISDYIQDPMTATTVAAGDKTPNREIITSELIYYWMIAFNIPFECQRWHLSRLMTLINVCNAKNTPSKKMSKSDTLRSNTSLNAARKKAMRTSG